MAGWNIPTTITVYEDKSFDFIMKQPPASDLIKAKAGIKKGTDNPLKNMVGKITTAQLQEIVKQKIVDMNTDDEAQAAKIIAGSARSMGVEIVD
jgi:large subunit ribosomal protein L11